jgi:hypothetical protein
MPGGLPEPGPPCATTARLPSGLPLNCQYSESPSRTSGIPVADGSIGGYSALTGAVVTRSRRR